MLRVLNEGDAKASMTPDVHRAFVQACEVYIGELKAAGQLIAAQPLVRAGVMLSGGPGAWTEAPFDPDALVQVGYYHIRAQDLTEAVAIAKRNPEFAYVRNVRVEVRPIKGTEVTGFTYPSGAKG